MKPIKLLALIMIVAVFQALILMYGTVGLEAMQQEWSGASWVPHFSSLFVIWAFTFAFTMLLGLVMGRWGIEDVTERQRR